MKRKPIVVEITIPWHLKVEVTVTPQDADVDESTCWDVAARRVPVVQSQPSVSECNEVVGGDEDLTDELNKAAFAAYKAQR